VYTETIRALTGEEIVALTKKHTIFEWSAQSKADPIPVAGAKGCWFWTPEEKRYLDFNSQLMCVNIGHGDERVVRAIQEQVAKLPYISPFMATEVRARLGEKLAQIAPGDIDTFFFTNGGADANENALKIARLYTGRYKVLARYRSYHGGTMGAASLTGDPRRLFAEPGIPGVIHVLDPYHGIERGWDTAEQALIHLEEIIQLEGPQSIAAFFLETVTGTNGILIPPDGYLEGVRELCTKYGILMICDEVMSGFGRTGEWFAVNHWNVVPDLADRGALQGSHVPERSDLQQPPARLRRGACDDRRLRGGRSHRERAPDGADHEGPTGRSRAAPSDRRRDAVDRLVRDRRACQGQEDPAAARPVRRDVRRDDAIREGAPRRGPLHLRPMAHLLHEPAALYHRGGAP
jgi:Aminotransferase class-III